jgi:deoxyribodipyrimidine photo-lyase
MILPVPAAGRDAATAWVGHHLADLCDGAVVPSDIRGGQTAADAALAALDITGYARRRSTVLPVAERGASQLSPYIRHGLLQLQRVWDAVGHAPAADRRRFRDELLWQEYARHLYARVGEGLATPLRHALPPPRRAHDSPPVGEGLRCVDETVGELQQRGWIVNQARMWLASHWTVREGADWREGEELMFRHLLDGSRAANRLGWQWTTGQATGRAYGFARDQVRRQAAALCGRCDHRAACPIEDWPADPALSPVEDAGLGRASGPARLAGPAEAVRRGRPEAVWLTAESLGDDDPALAGHPELPAVFVFDRPLLARLRLSAGRLVFLAECLADLAGRRPLEVRVGDVPTELGGRPVAVTWAPVPGFARRAERVDRAVTHPWPWLVAPSGRPVRSFSAWRPR